MERQSDRGPFRNADPCFTQNIHSLWPHYSTDKWCRAIRNLTQIHDSSASWEILWMAQWCYSAEVLSLSQSQKISISFGFKTHLVLWWIQMYHQIFSLEFSLGSFFPFVFIHRFSVATDRREKESRANHNCFLCQISGLTELLVLIIYLC